ncbi:hypothetical protein HDU76_003393 [Blyttiomyces sp. JEL0837]|nr:hypothetical protein HDU76_003393 [Blyttiomyces sp. JEL0837]
MSLPLIEEEDVHEFVSFKDEEYKAAMDISYESVSDGSSKGALLLYTRAQHSCRDCQFLQPLNKQQIKELLHDFPMIDPGITLNMLDRLDFLCIYAGALGMMEFFHASHPVKQIIVDPVKAVEAFKSGFNDNMLTAAKFQRNDWLYWLTHSPLYMSKFMQTATASVPLPYKD